MSDRLDIHINTTEIKGSDIVYDLETQEFAINLQSDLIDPADIALLTPRLSHLNKPFSVDANLSGKLPQADVTVLIVKYGKAQKSILQVK